MLTGSEDLAARDAARRNAETAAVARVLDSSAILEAIRRNRFEDWELRVIAAEATRIRAERAFNTIRLSAGAP